MTSRLQVPIDFDFPFSEFIGFRRHRLHRLNFLPPGQPPFAIYAIETQSARSVSFALPVARQLFFVELHTIFGPHVLMVFPVFSALDRWRGGRSVEAAH